MDEIREIGGSRLSLWWGNKLAKIGRKYIDKGNKTVISNPICKFFNPFTMVITFTIDNTKKYQLVNQGDYKEQYKKQTEDENEECPVTIDEMFMMITTSSNRWFKKE